MWDWLIFVWFLLEGNHIQWCIFILLGAVISAASNHEVMFCCSLIFVWLVFVLFGPRDSSAPLHFHRLLWYRIDLKTPICSNVIQLNLIIYNRIQLRFIEQQSNVRNDSKMCKKNNNNQVEIWCIAQQTSLAVPIHDKANTWKYMAGSHW